MTIRLSHRENVPRIRLVTRRLGRSAKWYTVEQVSCAIPYLIKIHQLNAALRYLNRSLLDGLVTDYITGSSFISAIIVRIIAVATITYTAIVHFKPILKFIWHCFLVPIGHADQSQRLNKVS